MSITQVATCVFAEARHLETHFDIDQTWDRRAQRTLEFLVGSQKVHARRLVTRRWSRSLVVSARRMSWPHNLRLVSHEDGEELLLTLYSKPVVSEYFEEW